MKVIVTFCHRCQREFGPGVGHDCTVNRTEFDQLRADVTELAALLRTALGLVPDEYAPLIRGQSEKLTAIVQRGRVEL